MSIDIAILLQTYLPEIFGAFFMANALFFFGRNDRLGKNNLVFASLGLLVLVFKDLFNIYALSFPSLSLPAIPAEFSALINVAMTSLAAICLAIGGFEYAHVLAWIKKSVAFFICILMWYAAIFAAFTLPDKGAMLPTIYLTTGFAILGAFFLFARFNSKAYTLHVTGIFVWVLAFYYFQSALPKGLVSWPVETGLYFLIIWQVYRSAIVQSKRETQELAKELRATQAKIPMIIQASPFPIMISALKDDRLLLVNEKASALFNIDMNNIKQFRTEDYYVDPNTRKELLQKLSISPTIENFQALLRKPNTNESFWLEISARVIEYDNEVALYLAFKDITAQKQYEQDLFEKAVLDPLTGCYNRRQFQELALKEIRRSWRYDTQFCVLMMDIDHFKLVNDTHGHAFGDEVLKALARTSKKTLRETDIFARFGGEEFICLLTQTNIENGACVAERLRQNIEACGVPLPSGEMFHFTASIGIVGCGATDDLDELIKRADSALYMAKENGRNQVRVYGEKENFNELKQETLQDTSASHYSNEIIEKTNAQKQEQDKKG